jgi:hypothetical protein
LKAEAAPCDSSQYTRAADVAVLVSQYKRDVVEDVVAGEVAGRLALEKGVETRHQRSTIFAPDRRRFGQCPRRTFDAVARAPAADVSPHSSAGLTQHGDRAGLLAAFIVVTL